MTSLMIANKQKEWGYRFFVFDCLGDEDADYLDILDEFEEANLCEVVIPRRRTEVLKHLCDEIASNSAIPTILVILGQERFRELKNNRALGDDTSSIDNDLPTSFEEATAMWKMEEQETSNVQPTSIKTTRDALNYIMDEGPLNGVHTILQVDKPNSFLFPEDGRLDKNNLYKKCKHIILLRSEYNSLMPLYISDDKICMSISKFEDNPDRLRAYYYNDEDGKYQLFTPFILPDKNIINNINK